MKRYSRRKVLHRGAVGATALVVGLTSAPLDLVDAAPSEMPPMPFQQAPQRNASVVGVQVYSHSGEYSPRVVDVMLPCRGLSFAFVRKYRSALASQVGPLGRGWGFTYAQQLVDDGRDIVYYDGLGRTYRFTATPDGNGYNSPDDLYVTLAAGKGQFVLQQRHGLAVVFEEPTAGGRLLAIQDRYGNTLGFKYGTDELQVTDPFGRVVILTYKQGLITQMRDHAGRAWDYTYNADSCLIAVVQPATSAAPTGGRIRYEYDKALRLTSVVAPNGHTVLVNSYDHQGRVTSQKHGNGYLRFEYDVIATTAEGFPIYRTRVQQKNGSNLVLTHDARGHVVKRTLMVATELLAREDRGKAPGKTLPLTTTSKFNRHGELIARTYPAGDRTEWTFAEHSADGLARGNLLSVVRRPAPGVRSDQPQIQTRFTYEPTYQLLLSLTDARGNTTSYAYDERGSLTTRTYPAVTIPDVRNHKSGLVANRKVQLVETFAHNSGGQLIRRVDARGAVTDYFYYAATDPAGLLGATSVDRDRSRAGGYLGRVVRDAPGASRTLTSPPAKVVLQWTYDSIGNVTSVRDGKGQATRFQYDALNRPVKVIAPAPLNYELAIGYDANGNPVDTAISFEHFAYDATQGAVVPASSILRQRVEYNALNNVVRRVRVIDGREIAVAYHRDADENIVGVVQPLGNVIVQRLDERGLVVERRFGAGTTDETVHTFAYTRNGRLRARTDGRGSTRRYDYDGYHCLRGSTNAGGTVVQRQFDAAGNITQIEVIGDPGAVTDAGSPVASSPVSLLLQRYGYDELGRRMRVDQAWHTYSPSPTPQGHSLWDGTEGFVSTIIEYGHNHLPIAIWDETDNILGFEYDGANRLTGARSLTGESFAVQYDAAGDPVRIERFGPNVPGGDRFHQVIAQEFDALHRLVSRSTNGEPAQSYAHNALGARTSYTNQAGAEVRYLYDALGRPIGRARDAVAPAGAAATTTPQTLVAYVEWDDNDRIAAAVNAAGHRTRYTYDALNRRTAVIFPDGTATSWTLDAGGRATRRADQAHNVVTQRFDALERLVERRVTAANGTSQAVEVFHYDGLNRLVTAATKAATVVRRYDSLSRLLEEVQGSYAVRYAYDVAGNMLAVNYPSGAEARRAYDRAARLIALRDVHDNVLARYTYRFGRQVSTQTLGGVLSATFRYEPTGRAIREVVYRSSSDGSIIDGTRYTYDSAGNRLQEAQLQRGDRVGERYTYDSAKRLVLVQYDVANLDAPWSAYGSAVQYDRAANGTWRQRVVSDARRRIVTRWVGTTNALDVYTSLGPRRYKYDARGNRILEQSPDGVKRYTYDYANRLTGIDYHDARGSVLWRVTYAYDAFNRRVRKTVTDAGGTRKYTYVWNGRQMIEEREDGRLARSYVYGTHASEPVAMQVHAADLSISTYYYTRNGRQLVTALVDSAGHAAERYRYDVFLLPYVSEINGQSVSGSQRPPSSILRNPLFIGQSLWESEGECVCNGGSAYDPNSGQPTNAQQQPATQPSSTPSISPWWGVMVGVGKALYDYGKSYQEINAGFEAIANWLGATWAQSAAAAESAGVVGESAAVVGDVAVTSAATAGGVAVALGWLLGAGAAAGLAALLIFYTGGGGGKDQGPPDGGVPQPPPTTPDDERNNPPPLDPEQPSPPSNPDQPPSEPNDPNQTPQEPNSSQQPPNSSQQPPQSSEPGNSDNPDNSGNPDNACNPDGSDENGGYPDPNADPGGGRLVGGANYSGGVVGMGGFRPAVPGGGPDVSPLADPGSGGIPSAIEVQHALFMRGGGASDPNPDADSPAHATSAADVFQSLVGGITYSDPSPEAQQRTAVGRLAVVAGASTAAGGGASAASFSATHAEVAADLARF